MKPEMKMRCTKTAYCNLSKLPAAQRGLSLIELLIAAAIGLILLAVVTILVVEQNKSRDELDKSTRMIENGRYAMQVLNSELQLAGYWGEYDTAGEPSLTSVPNPCVLTISGSGDLDEVLLAAVQGEDSPTSLPSDYSGCGISNFKSGTDILVVRRADTQTVATGSAGQVYVQTGLNTSNDFTKVVDSGPSTNFVLKDKDGVTANLRKYHVTVFYISTCNVCSPNDGIPTLKKTELGVSGGSAAWSTSALVEGIENMQLDYGLDSDSDGAPDSYATSLAAADIANVMTVRVNLLARNDETTDGYSDSKTYSLGLEGSVGPFADTYKRHAFTGVVRLINPSGRRDQ